MSGVGREECVLRRIVTEGWGEAHGSPWPTRASIEAPHTHATAQGLRHILLGQALDGVARLRRPMERGTQWIGRGGMVMQAIVAAAPALWAVATQRAGLPVAQLSGADHMGPGV